MVSSTRQVLIKALVVIVSLVSFIGIASADKASRPNFIVIFADDQGYQDLGCFGSPLIKTPNIDKMAAEGMRFTDFYSANSVCTPSRAALLTGCYPPRVGQLRVLFPSSTVGLNPKEINIANMLKSRGYATACVGKWHLGHQKKFLPTSQGFDEYYGIPYSNDMSTAKQIVYSDKCNWREGITRQKVEKAFADPKLKGYRGFKYKVPLMRNTECVEFPADQSTLTKRYTEEAVKFITKNKNNPFFLYLPHTMPHIPLFASEKFKGTSKRGLYGDVIEEIDWCVGQVLKTLKKLGLDDNTLVVYTSDNGPWLIFGKDGGCALPLRDGKFSVYEGGMREPCVMRWPGKIPAGTLCSEVCGTIDMLPTIARLSGGAVKTKEIIDGKDIWPLMSGKKGAVSPHEAYYYYKSNATQLGAIRKGKWKLHLSKTIRKRNKNKKAKKKWTESKTGVELYDLSTDIAESKNVAEDNPKVVKELTKIAKAFDAQLKKNARQPGKI
ncbi:MAG: sulfatase [Planctomycetes bacterium]|nr:sulfatase [Planctomycetota bacterium]